MGVCSVGAVHVCGVIFCASTPMSVNTHDQDSPADWIHMCSRWLHMTIPFNVFGHSQNGCEYQCPGCQYQCAGDTLTFHAYGLITAVMYTMSNAKRNTCM